MHENVGCCRLGTCCDLCVGEGGLDQNIQLVPENLEKVGWPEIQNRLSDSPLFLIPVPHCEPREDMIQVFSG